MRRAGMRNAVILATLLAPSIGWTTGGSTDGGAADEDGASAQALRVCADPNNLPFTNQQEQGFENRLAELIAAELGRSEVQYTWFAQRRGFIRNTLDADNCDVVMGQPADSEMVLTTEPYYRSTYAMVYRKDADYAPQSLDDPALRDLKIGLIFVGDDGNMPPPWAALRARDITKRGRLQRLRRLSATESTGAIDRGGG
ncbi:MAG: transporter substrate-binding domain-containing protein [Gammaproteobacteria bacterium]